MKTPNCAASPSNDHGARATPEHESGARDGFRFALPIRVTHFHGNAGTRGRGRAWLLAAAFVAASASADFPLEIIQLQARFAEDLIPLLTPLAGPDGTVTGANATLFVRASPARLADLRRALATLDRPPRSLLIQVRQRQDDTRGGTRVGAAVRGQVGTDGRRTAGSGTLDLDAAAGHAADSRDLTQQVRTLDGHRAYISTGEDQPVSYGEVAVGPQGPVLIERSVYQARTSGFYVIPRVQGDQVVLELAAGMDGAGPLGTGRTSEVQAQVQGRLGDWLPVALSTDNASGQSAGTLHSAQGYRDTRARVELRVIPLD